MRPLPSALAKALLLGAGTFVGLAGAELLIRVTNGARYAERPTFYPKDDSLGWAPAPGLNDVYYGEDFAITVATDADGARLGRLGVPQAGAPRVVLLGDSYTFGWGVSTEETFASLLDDLMAEHDELAGSRTVNLGVGGYGTLQSAVRLERYLADHSTVPVRAVVLLHSHNDPSDNVLYAAVRSGLREYIERPRNRGLHLHNLVRFLADGLARRSEAPAGTLPGGHRDFLYTVGAFLTEEGKAVDTFEGAPPGSAAELLASEQEVLPTYDRASLTRLQLELVRESVARVDRAAAERSVPVLHAVIHSAPDWYVTPLRTLVEEDASLHTGASWCGRVPAFDEYEGPYYNEHSGSHFSPELNAYYARKLLGWLEQGGCRPDAP